MGMFTRFRFLNDTSKDATPKLDVTDDDAKRKQVPKPTESVPAGETRNYPAKIDDAIQLDATVIVDSKTLTASVSADAGDDFKNAKVKIQETGGAVSGTLTGLTNKGKTKKKDLA